MKFHSIIFFEIQFLMIKLLRRNREDKTEKGSTVREKRSQLVISWPRLLEWALIMSYLSYRYILRKFLSIVRRNINVNATITGEYFTCMN